MEPRPTVLVHLLSSRYQSVCDYYSKWRSVAMATEQVRASNCDIGSFEFQAITKSTDGGVGWAPLPFPPPPPPPKHTLPQAAVTKLYKHSPLPLPGKERCGRGGGEGGRGSCDPHVICPRNCRFNTGRAASPRRCKKWRERVISIHRVLNWFKSPVATRLPVVGNMTVVKVPHYLSPPPPPHSPFTGFPDLHSLEGRCGAVERSQVNEDQLPVY